MRLYIITTLLLDITVKCFCDKKESSDLCLNGWLLFRDHCYLVVNEGGLNYKEAKKECGKYKATLTSIKSKDESDFLQSTITTTEYWLGVTKNNSFWVWDDTGRSVTYTQWDANEPSADDNCAVNNFNGKWESTHCLRTTGHRGYVCKKKHEGHCQEHWEKFWDSCYKYDSEALTREKAKKKCSEIGQTFLTSILAKEEDEFHKEITFEQPFWTGLMFVGKKWIWEDGSAYKYSNWYERSDKLNTKALIKPFMYVKHDWHLSNGSTKIGFVCKTRATLPLNKLVNADIASTMVESELSLIQRVLSFIGLQNTVEGVIILVIGIVTILAILCGFCFCCCTIMCRSAYPRQPIYLDQPRYYSSFTRSSEPLYAPVHDSRKAPVTGSVAKVVTVGNEGETGIQMV